MSESQSLRDWQKALMIAVKAAVIRFLRWIKVRLSIKKAFLVPIVLIALPRKKGRVKRRKSGRMLFLNLKINVTAPPTSFLKGGV
jgi:hypothetical protein